MPSTLIPLTIDAQLTTSAAAYATAGASSGLTVTNAVFTNSHTSTVTVTVWRLGNGTTAAADNYLVIQDIPPAKSWICQELIGASIENAGTIEASADVTDVVNFSMSGLRNT